MHHSGVPCGGLTATLREVSGSFAITHGSIWNCLRSHKGLNSMPGRECDRVNEQISRSPFVAGHGAQPEATILPLRSSISFSKLLEQLRCCLQASSRFSTTSPSGLGLGLAY